MKLLIIDTIWTPYAHARYKAIAGQKDVELVVLYQAETNKFRKWKLDNKDVSFKSEVLKNVSIPLFPQTAFSLSFNWDVYRRLKFHNPDRIIMCGWESLTIIFTIIYAKLHKKEIILSSGSTKYEKSVLRTLTKPYVRLLLKFFNGFISYGTAATEYLRSLGVTKEITPFYNSVDNEFFREIAANIDTRKTKTNYDFSQHSKLIIFSGRLVEIKCVDMLINVFHKLCNEFSDIELLIVGYGPEEQNLRKVAGDSTKVHFLGNKSMDDLAELYAISDILALPSKSEPWGLVVNEAMVCGCAVVVSDACGSSRDLIKGNGLVFKCMDSNELYKKLKALLGDDVLLEKMKVKSQDIMNDYDIDKLVKKVKYFT